MGKCHELYPCLEQVQHSFTEYKSYMYMLKSRSQFNYLWMPLVEQELLILPQKIVSPKVLMEFTLLDLQFPVGRGQIPPFISVHLVDRFSRASCSKILLAQQRASKINFLSQPLFVGSKLIKCYTISKECLFICVDFRCVANHMQM